MAVPEVVARIHTPCAEGDSPLPTKPCDYPDHVAEVPAQYHRLCRVFALRAGDHLWFGSRRPDGPGNWLQVGAWEQRPPYPISRVVGHLWFTSPAEGSRLLVENLSARNTLELSSPRMPQPLKLFPAVQADDEQTLSEVLGTPMAAVQTRSTTLTIVNRSARFVVWIETPPMRPVLPPPVPVTFDPLAAGSERAQRELDDAARRIQLAAPENYELLRDFLQTATVQERLASSESLRAFALKRQTSKRQGTWQEFVEKELGNVRDGHPSHEIHRLILEAIGTPPRHQSREYTDLVSRQLHPDRAKGDGPGGSYSGLSGLIPEVKGHWKFRRAQLKEYLERDRGLGLGRDLD